MASYNVLITGAALMLISGYFGGTLIYRLVAKKKLNPEQRTQHWFYLLIGFSPFYFFLAVFLLGLLLVAGGSGLIELKMG